MSTEWDDPRLGWTETVGSLIRACGVLDGLLEEIRDGSFDTDPVTVGRGHQTVSGVVAWVEEASGLPAGAAFADVPPSPGTHVDPTDLALRVANLRGWLEGRLVNMGQARKSK